MKMLRTCLFLTVVLCPLALCSVPAKASDCIGYWKFDEGVGAVAYDSCDDNDGYIIDNAIWNSRKGWKRSGIYIWYRS
ncbi:MAG: hypothetical protein JW837_06355 [Sedimentisphaerales bacterium]|nr:hypothetical protein [Sedimentisphaerales bacterium]